MEESVPSTKQSSQKQISPGDPLKAVYEITGLKPGVVKITFYETQPWNKDFKDIIKKVIDVQVVEWEISCYYN